MVVTRWIATFLLSDYYVQISEANLSAFIYRAVS